MYGVPDGLDWTFLVNREVLQIGIGLFTVLVRLDEGDISIEGRYAWLSQGKQQEGDAESPSTAIMLTEILGRKVQTCSKRDDITLEIHFENGVLLLRDDRPEYQSFVISVPGVTLIV